MQKILLTWLVIGTKYSPKDFNQHVPTMNQFAEQIQDTPQNLKEWIDSGGETPKTIDHRQLKKFCREIFKTAKTSASNR
eukprot:UN11136